MNAYMYVIDIFPCTLLPLSQTEDQSLCRSAVEARGGMNNSYHQVISISILPTVEAPTVMFTRYSFDLVHIVQVAEQDWLDALFCQNFGLVLSPHESGDCTVLERFFRGVEKSRQDGTSTNTFLAMQSDLLVTYLHVARRTGEKKTETFHLAYNLLKDWVNWV